MMFRSNIGMIVRIAVTKGDEGRCWFLRAAVIHSSSFSGIEDEVNLAYYGHYGSKWLFLPYKFKGVSRYEFLFVIKSRCHICVGYGIDPRSFCRTCTCAWPILPIKMDRGWGCEEVDVDDETVFTFLKPSRTFRRRFRSSAVIVSALHFWCGVVLWYEIDKVITG